MNESTEKILALLKKLSRNVKSKQTRLDLKLIELHVRKLDADYDVALAEVRYNMEENAGIDI